MQPTESRPRSVRREVIGLFILTAGVLVLAGAMRSDGGALTRVLVNWLRLMFGVGVYVVGGALVLFGLLYLFGREEFQLNSPTIGAMLLVVMGLSTYHLTLAPGKEFAPGPRESHGGVVAGVVVSLLRKMVGESGTYVVLVAITVLALLLVADMTVSELLARLAARRKRRPPAPPQPEQPPVVEEPTAETETAEDLSSNNSALAAEAPPPARPRRRRRGASKALSRYAKCKHLPPHFFDVVDALAPPDAQAKKEAQPDLEAGVRLVESTLASFRIEAKVTQVKRGPVVTRYEIQPAPGIRVNRITNLADDLALALAAIDVRVEAPVPGHSVIGIEVPNKRNTLVRLREIVELEEFVMAESKLTFALGQDIAGNPMIGDLTQMPHLLIGGATNSGKSVCLNAVITSILSRATPDEVRFSLIDPKRVELTLFEDIPHLFHPVVVDAKDAVRALRGSILEMERRYKLFSERGVRNIAIYNQRLEEGESPLYYIVIVIDELADLMMQAAAEFERLICRIAQMARATGIHLVVATQRPSVNVITGVIKANISSRIAFAVASQVDSRTILDVNGAERLIGKGDMLYHPIERPKPVRLQGAFIDENELNRVVECLRVEPDEDRDFGLDLEAIEEETPTAGGKKSSDRDALFDVAVQLVRARGQASASMLQRELEIGYPRAGRLIDQLEQEGVVGPADGSKPREVLVSRFDSDLVGAAASDE